MEEDKDDKEWRCPKTLKELLDQVVVEDEGFEEFDPEIFLEELRILREETEKLLLKAKSLGDVYLISSLEGKLELLDGWEKEIKDVFNDDEEGEY